MHYNVASHGDEITAQASVDVGGSIHYEKVPGNTFG
jgi:hypothetical protein